MSSQEVEKIKAHFLTSQQWEGKDDPPADELWFVQMPHWLKYSSGGCLNLTTQPTASGNEINFYAGASFVVNCGKNSDGTNNNKIITIDEDKYLSVSSDGGYCFDEYGNMISGNITYDGTTNRVSVDGIEGNYTRKVQSYTYDGETVYLDEDVSLISTSVPSIEKIGDVYVMDYGNGYIEMYGKRSISSSTTFISFPFIMRDTNYSLQISCQGTSVSSFGTINNSSPPTQGGFSYYCSTSYAKQLYWYVKGVRA